MKKWIDLYALWLLVAVALVGLFLRLYHLPDLFFYTMDEEVMNLIQRRIVLGEHFPLIGSVSPLNTYLGPIFYYFGAAILFFSNLDPLGQGFFATLLGTFTIFLIYFVGSQLFNKVVGLLAAVFYSFSFLQVIFDRRYWHLTPGPFLSLLVLYSIYKIKTGSIKFVFLLVAALIFGWNTDYTNLVLFLFTVITWILFKLPIKRKEVAVAVVIFLLSNLPLLAFDLRHNFLNASALLNYFTNKTVKKEVPEIQTNLVNQRETLGGSRTEQAFLTGVLPLVTFSRAMYTKSNLNIAEQHTYCKDYIASRNSAQGIIFPLLALLLIIYFAFLFYKHRSSKERIGYQLVLSFYLIFQLGVLIYAFVFKGDVFEHYLVSLMPYLFIILAVVIYNIYNSKFKILSFIFVLAFISGNSYLVFNAYNTFGYKDKLKATEFALSEIGSRDFSLDSIGSCFRYDGYYYPFILNGRHPVKSYQDPNYSWLYDYEVSEKHPKRVVVMVSKGEYEKADFFESLNRYEKWVLKRKIFGGIEVLILDNSKGDFN